jgi:glutamine synthetase
VIREYVVETKAIRFEGNGYSDEWRVEAAERGLLNLAKTPEALKQLVAPATKKLFTKTGVYRPDELESRYHLELERYIKDLEIEVAAMDELVLGFVLPAAYKHQGQLASSIEAVMDVLDSDEDEELLAPQLDELRAAARLIAELKQRLAAMRAAMAATHGKEPEAVARALADKVVPALEAVRDVCDRVEAEVDDALWPLPKYREMLFVV